MAKSEEDESAEATGNTRAKDLGGKARKASKGKASEVVVAEAAEDALAKPSEGEVVAAREERWTDIVEGHGAETKIGHLSDDVDSFQKLGIEQLESSTAAAPSFLDIVQAIAAEASDYSRRSLEHGTSFVEKLFGATTFESALLIQSEYARASCAGRLAIESCSNAPSDA